MASKIQRSETETFLIGIEAVELRVQSMAICDDVSQGGVIKNSMDKTLKLYEHHLQKVNESDLNITVQPLGFRSLVTNVLLLQQETLATRPRRQR